MEYNTKIFIVLGSINSALSVILGAFGAHVLKGRFTEDLMATFHTGTQYHFFHSLGLFAVAFVASLLPNSLLTQWSGWLMFVGIIIFSGSLYLLCFTGIRWLGAITPLGGLSFIIAWLLLTIAVLKA